jgi:hypothetical protein
VSEAERLRRLHVENRLQELASKYGEVVESEPATIDTPLPAAHPLSPHDQALHQDLLEQERGRVPRYVSEDEAKRWSAAGLALDRYGETRRIPCSVCDAPEGIKASVPAHMYYCASCGRSGPSVRLLEAYERKRPQPRQTRGGADW